MATRKEIPPPKVDLRMLLAEHERESERRRPAVCDPDLVGVPVFGTRAPTLADRLDAGDTVVVPAWKLRRWVPRPMPFDAHDHVRIEADGRLTIVDPVYAPDDPLSVIGYTPREAT